MSEPDVTKASGRAPVFAAAPLSLLVFAFWQEQDSFFVYSIFLLVSLPIVLLLCISFGDFVHLRLAKYGYKSYLTYGCVVGVIGFSFGFILAIPGMLIGGAWGILTGIIFRYLIRNEITVS
jgi:hypothetical protein